MMSEEDDEDSYEEDDRDYEDSGYGESDDGSDGENDDYDSDNHDDDSYEDDVDEAYAYGYEDGSHDIDYDAAEGGELDTDVLLGEMEKRGKSDEKKEDRGNHIIVVPASRGRSIRVRRERSYRGGSNNEAGPLAQLVGCLVLIIGAVLLYFIALLFS